MTFFKNYKYLFFIFVLYEVFSCTELLGGNLSKSTSPAWGGEILAINNKIAMMPISLGTADFMVYF